MESPPMYDEVVEDLNNEFSHANLHADDDDEAEQLIVGLDFGTTYSGLAYAFTSESDKIYTINEWPGARGRTSPKCPTLIKYHEGTGDFSWGFELDRTTAGRIEGIKLLLDPDQPTPLYVPAVNTKAELKKLSKPAAAVATDFLQAVFTHALRKIEAKYPKDYLDMLSKRYVLTVPAVWSDKAKDATLRAARNAGIGQVKLIKEPEAAALYTLHQMGGKGLQVGDALVLCDAGGGTVDLISYEILQLEPLELKELTECTGGLAGSLMLNKRFEEWIRDVVGDVQYIKLRETDAYRRAMKTFDENIKPGFRSRDDPDEFINFPTAQLQDNPSKGLVSDTITVTGETLHVIFEPVFREIDKLVKEQVNAVRLRRLKDRHPGGDSIKAIFLVGGFGSSAYLCESIQSAHKDVQVIQPNDAWSAIVRGAVMSRLPQEAKVTINLAPKHYGIECHSPHDENRDRGERKWWDKFEERYRVSRMEWYIHKGDDLHREREIEFPFFRSWDTYPTAKDLQFEETLLECSNDTAPVHPKPGLTSKNVSMLQDLSTVPKEYIKKKSRPQKNGSNSERWELHYSIMVKINSGPMLFSVRCGGKEYGKVGTEY